MALSNKQSFDINGDLLVFLTNLNIIRSFVIFNFLKIAITLLNLLGMFWNPQELLLMMGKEIFQIDASWAEKFTKTSLISNDSNCTGSTNLLCPEYSNCGPRGLRNS